MVDKLLEDLACLEHEQWMDWSKSIAKDYEELLDMIKKFIKPFKLNTVQEIFLIGQIERLDRWERLWVPYEDLSEEMKESDREYAQKVLDKIKENDIN